MKETKDVEDWYDKDYSAEGFKSQRMYPNEELLRFMGRNYFSIDPEKRKEIKFLETGCGSCANLWMIAREGFDCYGIDLSSEAIVLGEMMLSKWEVKGELKAANMLDIPFGNDMFDCLVDVFSSNCMNIENFRLFLLEASRVLKPGGKLFLFTPGDNSDAFINYEPAQKVDEYTINGIHRESSPYYGNFYDFRFSNKKWISNEFKKTGFKVNYLESVTRTYYGEQEKFEFLSIEAEKV